MVFLKTIWGMEAEFPFDPHLSEVGTRIVDEYRIGIFKRIKLRTPVEELIPLSL